MDKIFCGSGIKKEFSNGGSITTITIDIDAILREYDNYGFTTNQGKRTMKLKVSTKREVDQYGKTHSVEIDTWKPDGASNNQVSNPPSTQQPAPNQNHLQAPVFQGPTFGGDNSNDFEDDIPF